MGNTSNYARKKKKRKNNRATNNKNISKKRKSRYPYILRQERFEIQNKKKNQ